MASEQLRRENKTDEKQIHVEKDKVPKMKTHFESLTVKDTGDQPHVARHVVGTMHGGIHDQSEAQKEKMQDTTQSMQKKEGEYKGPSLEEISKDRGTAQQNSMDAILAAEEKYRKTKEMGGSVGQNEEKSSVQKMKEYTTQTALENAARASDFAAVKGQQTKESLSSAARTAAEKAAKAKDYTLQKSVQAKDVVAEKTTGIAGTVDVTKKGASYVGEKVVAAKDIAVETGKTTVGAVGKVAGVVKDKAVVAGWSAAEYASDKAVGATETMANVTAGVAGYAGDTVVKTKDVLVDVGKKTKDMVVSTEESVKDYAARKKTDKQRELEAKNSKDEGEFGEEENETNKRYDKWGGDQGYNQGGMMQEGDFEHQQGGGMAEGGFEHQEGRGGLGVMRLIGETLVEIGQNTGDMLTGQGGRYEGEQQRGGGNQGRY